MEKTVDKPPAKKTLVVNLFAGPGAGKTTCAWLIAGELKKKNLVVEYVPEYAKELVWDGKLDLLNGSYAHQMQVSTEQNHRVERLLGKVDVVVTDSPVLLGAEYAKERPGEVAVWCMQQHKSHHNFNLFIQRGQHYEKEGRTQDLAESRAIDKAIRTTLDEKGIFYGLYGHERLPIVVSNIQTTLGKLQKSKNIEKKKEGVIMATPTYTIYQLKDGEETRDYRFRSHDNLTRDGLAVNLDNYNQVYSAPLTATDTLDTIYEKFNIEHPEDFTGHSLSVSDVVVLHQGDTATAHYVDSFGFTEIPGFVHDNAHQPGQKEWSEPANTPEPAKYGHFYYDNDYLFTVTGEAAAQEVGQELASHARNAGYAWSDSGTMYLTEEKQTALSDLSSADKSRTAYIPFTNELLETHLKEFDALHAAAESRRERASKVIESAAPNNLPLSSKEAFSRSMADLQAMNEEKARQERRPAAQSVAQSTTPELGKDKITEKFWQETSDPLTREWRNSLNDKEKGIVSLMDAQYAMEKPQLDSGKQRLFIDMDGTLAVFAPQKLETLLEKGYFANLEPMQRTVDAAKMLATNPDIEVYIMSSVLSDSKYAIQEKNEWLDKNLPEIPTARRIYPVCGTDKKDYVPSGIRKDDVLWDDYTVNLASWEPPAKGVKLLNGINHTQGTWEGDRISYAKPPEEIANNVLEIMQGKTKVHDEKPSKEQVDLLTRMDNYNPENRKQFSVGDELSDRVLGRFEDEFQVLREKMLEKTPEEILDGAYKYATYEDIKTDIEKRICTSELEVEQLQKLEKTSLGELYDRHLNQGGKAVEGLVMGFVGGKALQAGKNEFQPSME